MEEEKHNPSGMNSFQVNNININFVELNKKRKLGAEQLGLPIPKHKCWDRNLPFRSFSSFDENKKVKDLHVCIFKGRSEGGAMDDVSNPESAKDSNNFAEDFDSAMSVYGEGKLEPEDAKLWPYDRPSTSSSQWGSCSLEDTHYSSAGTSGAGKEEVLFEAGGHNIPLHDDRFQVSHNLEEPLLEFGSHPDYICSEYGNNSNKQYTEKEPDDILYSSGVNPINYVLSSGRWSVNQDAQQGTRKPTIDQEFEQYFSTLML